jgi:hypothetical protein
MEIILAALLAGKTVLPAIDRETLEIQARAEALRPRVAIVSTKQRRASRRDASVGALDLATITTICRAAGGHAQPVAYVEGLGRAYELSGSQRHALRSNCAAYLDARADTMRILRTPR